jgi:hypothetical protein
MITHTHQFSKNQTKITCLVSTTGGPGGNLCSKDDRASKRRSLEIFLNKQFVAPNNVQALGEMQDHHTHTPVLKKSPPESIAPSQLFPLN